jgi:hypothetical protein
MKFTVFLGLTVALAVASMPARAFQEQQSGGAPVTPAPAAQAAPLETTNPGLGVSEAPAVVDVGEPGTEVRIPGLGTLGVLPKMDFGLELLYGARDAKQPDAVTDLPADDLRIRGSLKHNF